MTRPGAAAEYPIRDGLIPTPTRPIAEGELAVWGTSQTMTAAQELIR